MFTRDEEQGPGLSALAAGALVTALLVGAALGLGTWAYRHRQLTLHLGRLQRLVAARPHRPEVEAGLAAEGGRPLSALELARVLEAASPAERDAVGSRARQWPAQAALAVEGMAYVLFFDGDAVLRDFVVMRIQFRVV